MKKVVRVTMKKVQKIFDRRKNSRDGDSMTRFSEDGSCKSTQIEDGLEVNEDQPPFSPGNSTESSPEPLEMFQSSEDERGDYFNQPRQTNRWQEAREMKLSKSSGPIIVGHNGDKEGTRGPLVTDYKNGEQRIVPYSRVSENSCQSIVLTSCGELEKTCSNLPLELQAKISTEIYFIKKGAPETSLQRKMAENGSTLKKSLLSHVSEMFQKACNKSQKTNIKTESDPITQNLEYNFNASNTYDTWPSSRLRATIEDTVKGILNEENSKAVLNIIDELECELNNKIPVHIEEQLDFCMMCSEADQIEAIELQRNLCSQYDLVGKLFWECTPLGRDLLSVLEDIVKNSTILLFYISEQFDDTDACAYIARNLLMEQDSEGANRKVIPLVTQFDTPVPEMFQLIDKLYLCSKFQFKFRFPAVFTTEVKQEKILRAEGLKKKLDNERKAILQILIQKKLGL